MNRSKPAGRMTIPHTPRSFGLLGFALLAALVSTTASAAPTAPSVTAVVDYIESLATPIGLVGAAVLILLLGVKAYKWIRRAM